MCYAGRKLRDFEIVKLQAAQMQYQINEARYKVDQCTVNQNIRSSQRSRNDRSFNHLSVIYDNDFATKRVF